MTCNKCCRSHGRFKNGRLKKTCPRKRQTGGKKKMSKAERQIEFARKKFNHGKKIYQVLKVAKLI